MFSVTERNSPGLRIGEAESEDSAIYTAKLKKYLKKQGLMIRTFPRTNPLQQSKKNPLTLTQQILKEMTNIHRAKSQW